MFVKVKVIKVSSTILLCRNPERRPVGKKRLVSCAELVLDVDTKTQRVILKKKVLFSF